MGRCNSTSFDDLLLEKTKAVICQALDSINRNCEIEHVQALSSRETNERWSDESGMSAGAAMVARLARSKVTYEQFVEHLDGQDQFVKDIGELLVGQTIRKAISKSLSELATDPPRTQSERDWHKEFELSEKVCHGIRRLTQAIRRSETWDNGYSSSSSSSSWPSSDSDTALTPLDVTTVEPVPRPELFPPNRRETSETTRGTRVERTARLRRNAERAEAFSRQEDLLAQSARLSMQRQSLLLEARRSRELNRARTEERQRRDLERIRSLARSDGPVRNGSSSSSSNNVGDGARAASTQEDGGDQTATLIHRFLTQPFPSEARTPSRQSAARRARASSTSETNELALLSSIYGDATSVPPGPQHVDPVALSLDGGQGEANSSGWQGEFEAFARSRRHSQRSRLAADSGEQNRPREDDTFYRALDSLFRADETIQAVSQGVDAEASDAISTRSRSARRYDLTSLDQHRHLARLPPQRTRRED